jgi:hypothetical protein
MSSEPSFTIPAHPQRNFPARGRLEYEGETVFRLTPVEEADAEPLESLVEAVLDEGPYRSGDFLELPMALWLVRDDETADVFRVSIRDGAVRLHVLPATESAGLRRFYDRLVERSGGDWRVECRTDLA